MERQQQPGSWKMLPDNPMMVVSVARCIDSTAVMGVFNWVDATTQYLQLIKQRSLAPNVTKVVYTLIPFMSLNSAYH